MTEEQLHLIRNIAITQCATCLLALFLWAAVFFRIIYNKVDLRDLCIICVLMILYQIFICACGLYGWIIIRQSYLGFGTYSYGESNEVSAALINVSQALFGLAFWLFVFNYYAFSLRLNFII